LAIHAAQDDSARLTIAVTWIAEIGLVQPCVRRHLDRRGYDDIRIIPDLSLRASRSPIDHPFLQAAIEVAEQVYGQPPIVYPNHGAAPGSRR